MKYLGWSILWLCQVWKVQLVEINMTLEVLLNCISLAVEKLQSLRNGCWKFFFTKLHWGCFLITLFTLSYSVTLYCHSLILYLSCLVQFKHSNLLYSHMLVLVHLGWFQHRHWPRSTSTQTAVWCVCGDNMCRPNHRTVWKWIHEYMNEKLK